MPIYEYSCLDCSKTFEKIVWNTGDKEVLCPYCQGKNNLRILSAFSKGSGGVQGAFPRPPTVVLPAVDFPEPIDQEPWVLKEIL